MQSEVIPSQMQDYSRGTLNPRDAAKEEYRTGTMRISKYSMIDAAKQAKEEGAAKNEIMEELAENVGSFPNKSNRWQMRKMRAQSVKKGDR